MSKRIVRQHVFRLSTLSLIIFLIGGGLAFLLHVQSSALTHASVTGKLASCSTSNSFVCTPTLPASYVDSILRRMGSPMVGVGQAVENAARAQNIDDAFALAVWWTETNDGAAGVGLNDRNPGSVRGSVGYPSAYDGYTIYPSFTAAVSYWFSMVKNVYVEERGMTTVYAMAHTYVGTSSSGLWAGKVTSLMLNYRAEAPQIVTPTPTPAIPANTLRHAQAIATTQAQINAGYTGGITAQVQTVPQTSLSKQHQVLSEQVTLQSSSSGMDNLLKWMLVLFALTLSLVLALWAALLRRRAASSTKLATLLADKPHDLQQTATLLHNTGALHVLTRTTEALSLSSSTEGLALSQSMFTPYGSQGVSSPDNRFLTTPVPFAANPPARAFTGFSGVQQSFAGGPPRPENSFIDRTPAPEGPFRAFAHSAEFQPAFVNATPGPESSFLNVGATRRPPLADPRSVPETPPVGGPSLSMPPFTASTDSHPINESPARNTERSGSVNHSGADMGAVLNSTSMPRRTRLLPSQADRVPLPPSGNTSDSRSTFQQQPVPAGIGVGNSRGHSNGLLSRYREQQGQDFAR